MSRLAGTDVSKLIQIKTEVFFNTYFFLSILLSSVTVKKNLHLNTNMGSIKP